MSLKSGVTLSSQWGGGEEIECVFYINFSPSQFRLAIFKVFSSHIFLVPATLDSTALDHY